MAIPSTNIDELVQRASNGDLESMALAFQVFRPRLRRSVGMRLDPRLNGRLDPSDVVQETFLDAKRRFDEFVALKTMPLFLWLRLLAGQRLIDLHRQHLGAQMRNAAVEISLDRLLYPEASAHWLAEQLIERHSSASSVVMRAELQRDIQAALSRMDTLDREILAMRHFELLTNHEIALSLGISSNAASNRYVRALRRLRELLPMDNGP